MNETQELSDRIARLEEKTEAIFQSVEKTRRYFKATLYVTIITIVLPAIGLLFVIPFFLKTLGSSYGGFDTSGLGGLN